MYIQAEVEMIQKSADDKNNSHYARIPAYTILLKMVIRLTNSKYKLHIRSMYFIFYSIQDQKSEIFWVRFFLLSDNCVEVRVPSKVMLFCQIQIHSNHG